jgi:hypothetical protein
MNAEELIAAAEGLVDGSKILPGQSWPYAAAVLARQALEVKVREIWATSHTEMLEANTASQLIGLRLSHDADAVGRLKLAWTGLSRTLHNTGHELPPTAEELDRWLAAIRDLK